MRLARSARIARRAAAFLVLLAAAYGFLAADGVGDFARGLAASWQLFPGMAGAAASLASILAGATLGAAIGAASTATLLALPLLVLSSLFGRWYCAALCPVGALQDLASWLSPSKRRYRRPATKSRIAAASFAVALGLLGSLAAASWLDPWSLFGRFLSFDVRPVVLVATRSDVPGFDPWISAASAAAMAAILLLAALRGRWFCGALCPVGSFLGLINRVAPLRLRLDQGTCIACGACASACPASCIDASAKRIDDGRCVYCLECLPACPTKAIYYGRPRISKASTGAGPLAPPARAAGRGHPISRSLFLATMGAALGGTASALALTALPRRGLVPRRLPRPEASTPPGSISIERFLEACTACGLCASACPSSVLQPSLGPSFPRGLLAPRLDYSISYCQYECVSCLEVCPSGALRRMPLEAKKLTKIGDATLVRELCIVFTQKTKCGSCAEHCPTGAVRMISSRTGIPEPLFTSSICIGCGACHYACPVRPEKAITVAALEVHAIAQRPTAALLGETDAGEGEAGKVSGGEEFPF